MQAPYAHVSVLSAHPRGIFSALGHSDPAPLSVYVAGVTVCVCARALVCERVWETEMNSLFLISFQILFYLCRLWSQSVPYYTLSVCA